MTTIKLNFVNRIKLMSVLTIATGLEGGLDKLNAFLKMYEKIRFSEEEVKQMIIKDLGNGNLHYEIIQPQNDKNFGSKIIKLEDAHAKWLLKEMESVVKMITMSDLQWFNPLYADLQKSD